MRVGIDIVELDRIDQARQASDRFASKILSQEELALYEGYSDKRQISFLAGRYSVKEAYAKALGTGIGHFLKFRDLSIMPDSGGRPVLTQGPLLEGVSLSISHSKTDAIAMVYLDADEASIEAAVASLKAKVKEKEEDL